jgi:polar amino acid transport system ATP-binding protein
MVVMLRIENLNKTFGSLHVLKNINLSVPRNEKVVIIGPSGSGKSTLLRCINFLEEYNEGSVYFDGELVGYIEDENGKKIKRSPKEIAKQRSQIGIVFQSFNLFPHKNVLENIIMGPIHIKKKTRKEAENIAKIFLEKVGLMDKINDFPANLSGGQQQRVAIARALAMEPKLMLFDEVTSALDPELIGEVLHVMKDLAEEGMTMIVVTHEMDFAYDVANTLIFMDEGRVVEIGGAMELLTNPRSDRLKQFLNRYFETKKRGNHFFSQKL